MCHWSRPPLEEQVVTELLFVLGQNFFKKVIEQERVMFCKRCYVPKQIKSGPHYLFFFFKISEVMAHTIIPARGR